MGDPHFFGGWWLLPRWGIHLVSFSDAKVVPECKAVVLPMVKHPFVVGFLVAELPLVELETCVKAQSDGSNNNLSGEEDYSFPPFLDLNKKSWEIQTLRVKDEPVGMHNFTSDQRSNAIDISQSLAMAYVMDQKAMLLQQSTWQNNVRMNNLVEQIRGPLSSIQTLGKILSTQTKKSQISYDIVEDILTLGDRLSDVLHQLRDAVHLTKVLAERSPGLLDFHQDLVSLEGATKFYFFPCKIEH
ncbi:hypothetical protein TSUD_253830 [Trifolium subterraneum]|uniref:Signal transduction histidine kinase dimerisation/phosphoacceptor domain-containing protein n=1 Tax=Trifolium subterraneum TaxID=3900 RepID=A0A2Z6P7B9_TRISU|nr:hypothetical protein TSUD_253830 [Trifolium subterraneum]